MPRERHVGFWDWLFGNAPQDERDWCSSDLRNGMTALSVLIHNDAERHRVADILDDHDPVDLGDESSRLATGGSASADLGAAHTAIPRPELRKEVE